MMTSLFIFLGRDAIDAFGWRVPTLVVLMVLAGALEGLAVTAALPLLTQIGDGSQSALSSGILVSGLAEFQVAIGLPVSPIGVGILMLLFVGASATMHLTMARLAAKLQAQYVLGWQTSLFSDTLFASPIFLEAHRDGDIAAAIISEVTRVGGAFYHGCLIIAAIVNLSIYIVLAILISPAVSFAVVVLGSTLFVMTRPFMRRAFGYGKIITKAQADIQALSSECISSVKALKANVAEEASLRRFDEAATRLANANFSNAFDVQKAKAVFEFGGAAGLASLLVVGPSSFGVEISTVLVVLALFIRLLPRITALQQGFQALNVLLPALDNLHRLRTDVRNAAEINDCRPLPPQIAAKAPDISFCGVTVVRGNICALDNVDIDLPSGKIIALVGPSGSGKSTLVDAILGLVRISAGHVRIGDTPLDDIPLPAWRRSIGYVGQDTMLFAGTIADNVRLASNIDNCTIDAALVRAAARFVQSLPDRSHTEVGDRGSRLSGGERQRVGLARALALPRKLFILDEATSALDAETEAEVLHTVSGLAGDATVIVVAHRFSAVRDADLIYVLENGRVVESGAWATLDREGTRFFSLKRLQEVTPSMPEPK